MEKFLMLGKIEGRRRRGCQRIDNWMALTIQMNTTLDKLQEMIRDREAWGAVILGVTESDMTA